MPPLPTQMTALVESLLASIPILLPVSTMLMLWYFAIMAIIVFNFFVTIIFICFRSPLAQYVIYSVLSPTVIAVCALDILITLDTSFIQNGKLITERGKIVHNYIKNIYFIFDLFALLFVICQQILRYYFQNLLPFLNLLIFVKVFKVYNFDTLIKKYIIKSSTVLLYYQIIKHFILLIMVCHLIGSLFFYLDLKLIQLQWYDQSQLWVYSSYAHINIIQLDVVWQYCYAFYYAVVTLSGTAYGDLTPLNPTEVAFTFFSLLLPMLVYAYLFSVVYAAIGQRRNREIEAKKYKKIAMEYFKQSGIEELQAAKFVNYLSYTYVKKISVDNNYLDNLAPSTKELYLRSVLDEYFDFQIFQGLFKMESKISPNTSGNLHLNGQPSRNVNQADYCLPSNSTALQLKQIIYSTIQQQIYPAKQVFRLTKKIKNKQKLYFIITGSINEYIHIKDNKFNKIRRSNQFFGQYTFFTGIAPQHHNHLYQTNQFSICQIIGYAHFTQQLQKKRIIHQLYHSLRNFIIYGSDVGIIKTKCFFCQQNNHIIDQCPRLRIYVEPIAGYYQQNGRNKRYKRRIIKNRYKHYQCIKVKDTIQSMKQKSKRKQKHKYQWGLNEGEENWNEQAFEDKQIQTDDFEGSAQNKKYYDQKKYIDLSAVDVVENWKVFQSKYSLQ